jgi:hypothetical protein
MSDAQSLLDQIIAERGGIERFDATGLGVARRLATLLASDSDGSASTIAQLCELLPSKPSADEGEWNLELLTDEQFKQFDRLCSIARGEKPPSVEKPKPFRTRSRRERAAADLVRVLDRLEAAQDAARKAKQPHALTDGDLGDIRNAIVGTIGLVTLPQYIFAAEVDHATFTERAKWQAREREREAAEAAARTPPIAPVVAPAPADSNVIPGRWGTAITFGSTPRNSPGWSGPS